MRLFYLANVFGHFRSVNISILSANFRCYRSLGRQVCKGMRHRSPAEPMLSSLSCDCYSWESVFFILLVPLTYFLISFSLI